LQPIPEPNVGLSVDLEQRVLHGDELALRSAGPAAGHGPRRPAVGRRLQPDGVSVELGFEPKPVVDVAAFLAGEIERFE
jgi:hypothetical protein